jgi:sugar (glycoside-pentoside-hexuronide) transporter
MGAAATASGLADPGVLPDTETTLRPFEKLSYGMGDFAFGISWNVVGAFLLYFYVNVALLPVGVVGTIFLLSRLLDAGFDPVVGMTVDRTRSRWGRARPYFLFGAVPFGVLFVLTFVSPPWATSARLAWACITFLLLGLSFSVVNIPYSALMPMMTARRAELVRLGSLRAAGTAISVIVVTAATLPMVHVFGGGDDRRGFLRVALLFAGISVMLIFNLFAACRERIHDQDHRTIGTAAAVAAMLRNRAWVVVFLFIALNFMRFGTVLAVTAFFAVNVLHRPWMISALLPAVSGTLLIGSFIAPPLLRRWGMRMGNRLALIVAVALYLVLPFLEATPGAFIAAYLGASVALSITMTAMFAMAAETVDYHEQLFRIRNEGLLRWRPSLAWPWAARWSPTAWPSPDTTRAQSPRKP